jgi:F420-non-reducing hydrogenase large subunit
MTKRITIDPITRLEGHGKIEIFLDDQGDVARAFLQIPELRGYEKFCEGRLVEELPRITPTICGVCPTAHHMASTKTLDDLYKVDPPPAAKMIRELVNCAFMAEDHALHFYFLGGPDFVVGPQAPKAERNILGVIAKVGLEAAGHVIAMRKKLRSITTLLGGRVIHPVLGLPGGVAKALKEEDRRNVVEIAKETVEFGKFTLKVFDDIVLKNKAYVDVIVGDVFKHRTYYMGLVDKNNKVNFYDGDIRVVGPDGKEYVKFKPQDYLKHLAEHVEPWSYIKFLYLKNVGWKGFVDGEQSGVYRVAPLARLNAADGMATPLAQAEYERMFSVLGGKPVHFTLATHWARVIELLAATERLLELAQDPEITSPNIRTLPTNVPSEGVGVVEAPRGTLYHHYKSDERGVATQVNLLVATLNNSAAIAMSVEKAAKGLIKKGEVSDGLLNMVEMAFRAYDPCMACATHYLPGKMPLEINIRDQAGRVVEKIERR